jgi:hypothetical protein
MQFMLWRTALAGAGITIVALFGGMLLGVVVGNIVFNVLPGHNFMNPSPLHVVVAVVPALSGFIGGSAVWGIWMGRIREASNRKRMALAGALGFAPITLALGIALQVLEPIAVERLGAQFPIHRIFTFFFVPATFMIAGVSAWAIGIGLKDEPLARKLFLYVGTAAALGFLAMNLLMEALGWQVGGPNAAERLTMVTVLFAGNLAAAVVGGAVMGILLSRQSVARNVQMQLEG